VDTGRPAMTRVRPPLAAAVLLLVACAFSGCSGLRDVEAANAVSNTLRIAAAACSKAHAGTIGTVVTAGYASDQLQAAHMGPDPWSALPRSNNIFMCFGSPSNTDGIFLGFNGQRTTAPPFPAGDCKRTTTSYMCTGSGTPIGVLVPG
jgi:hypothetical protein